MTNPGTPPGSSEKESKGFKVTLIQGVIGAATLAGTTAIPILVQKALNPSSPTPSPTQSAPAQSAPTQVAPATSSPPIQSEAIDSQDQPQLDETDEPGKGRGKGKGKHAH